MPNVKAILNFFNQKVTNLKAITKERTCNCVDKKKCQNFPSNIIATKKKSTLVQLKLHSSWDTQIIKDHLSLYNTKQYKTDTELSNEVL